LNQDLTEKPETQSADPSQTEGPTLSEARGLGGRRAVELLVVLAVVVYLGYYTHTLPTLAVVAAIVAMIMIHELGHFIAAKVSHMKVTEYFLGFGPRVWSFRKGETEYGVKLLPLGGYVKIIGMSSADEVRPEDEPRTYRQASFPRRLAVAVAGSFMHFVMAFGILLTLLFMYGFANPNVVEIGAVTNFSNLTSPAVIAHLKPGEVILSADGKEVTSGSELANIIGSSVGKPVTLSVRDGSKVIHTSVVPVDGRSVKVNGQSYLPKGSKARGVIGIGIVAGNSRYSFFGALSAAGSDMISFSAQTVTSLASHFSPHGISAYFGQLVHPSTNPASKGAQARFASPVGIVRLASQAAQSGFEAVLALLFSINIFVGIFNMIPLLPLDGGHVVIAIYERIRSKRGRPYHADILKMMPLTYAVIFVLILISATALYLDITHPVGNPFVR
jgi:membrane-associated protease RseP (regulator of RpoE activity)